MSLPDPSLILEMPGLALSFAAGKLAKLLLSPGSSFSLASLFSALCIAILFLGLRRRGGREIRVGVLLRALFPRRLLLSPSSRADVGFFLFNAVLAGALFGWAILSYHLVSNAVNDTLVAAFGARAPTSLPASPSSGPISIVTRRPAKSYLNVLRVSSSAPYVSIRSWASNVASKTTVALPTLVRRRRLPFAS